MESVHFFPYLRSPFSSLSATVQQKGGQLSSSLFLDLRPKLLSPLLPLHLPTLLWTVLSTGMTSPWRYVFTAFKNLYRRSICVSCKMSFS